MSLARLLTNGKSLVGLKESVNRYRVSNQRLLPKFEAKKNPFLGTAPRQLGVEERQGELTADPANQSVEGQTAATICSRERAAGLPVRRRESLLARIWSRHSVFVGSLVFWRREKAGQPTAQCVPNRLFQAELSLEAVKVVRNDLSDSDVEVKAAVVAKHGAVDLAAPERLAKPAWTKVADRLFGAAKH